MERKVSLALGLENAFEIRDPYVSPQEEKEDFFVGNVAYNPFLIVAKNWKNKYFILFQGGPNLEHDLSAGTLSAQGLLHSAFHYRFSTEEDHYLGIEMNKIMEEGEFEMFVRPQIILDLSENFNLGATIGIPVEKPETKWSAFMRLAYEFN